MELQSELQLSKYALTSREVGVGPSSLVYIAANKDDKTECSLRITLRTPPEELSDRRCDARDPYEIDPRTLKHPNLLEYLDIFRADNLVVSAMTYCPGGSLEDLVLEPCNNYTNANLSKFLNRLAPLFNQITSAVKYLHTEKRLIHGNIKLTNIFLQDAERFRAVLGDLGSLKPVGDDGYAAPADGVSYTGTSIYIAPEVIAGGPKSVWSDIYAIGACVYVALDSKGPAPGSGLGEIRKVLEDMVAKDLKQRLLTLHDSSIQGPVIDFLDRTVQPLPEKRDTAEKLLFSPWLSALCQDGGGDEADRAPRLFITSPDGRDPDFELGKVMAATLMRRQQLRIIGFVAGLTPARMRARLIKGTLIELGLESIPVAVGEETGADEIDPSAHEFNVNYLATDQDLHPGTALQLFKETLLRSPDKTVTLVLQSGPTDVWRALETHPYLFARKVKQVVLRSQVQVADGKPVLSEKGYIQPDVSSASKLDKTNMCLLFEGLQAHGVPMLIVTRFAGYAISLPQTVYQVWGTTRHPVAQRILKIYRQSIQGLWDRCLLPVDDPRRQDLPARCNKEWFINQFLEGKGHDKGAGDSIVELCTTFNSFSSLQLMAAATNDFSRQDPVFFAPTEVYVQSRSGQSIPHNIVGLTNSNHGVYDPKQLSEHITTALLTGFTGTDRVQQRLLIISDDGKDLDDELVKVLMACLEERQLATCKAYIASLHPAELRARLAKGTLSCLGLDWAEVGVGSPMVESKNNVYEFDVDYLADPEDLHPSGVQLFIREMEAAQEDGLYVLVVLSGMRDAWELLRDNTELFRKKISRVVMMGGVQVEGNTVRLSEEGFMVPDTAANNNFDTEAANFFYTELQRQSIPMTIVSRWAAYAAKLPLKLYDRMATSGNPVAVRLQKAQQSSLQHLWVRACMAVDDPAREGLPARCNKDWFCETFLGGAGKDRSGSESVWDLATTFQAYDVIAVLGALPGIRERYLDPMVFTIRGLHGTAVHEVMGLNAELSGVRDSRALRSWMEEALLEGLATDTVSNRPTGKKVQANTTLVRPSGIVGIGSCGSLHEHHVRAFAQNYATKAPKMQSDRMQLIFQEAKTGFQNGLL